MFTTGEDEENGLLYDSRRGSPLQRRVEMPRPRVSPVAQPQVPEMPTVGHGNVICMSSAIQQYSGARRVQCPGSACFIARAAG